MLKKNNNLRTGQQSIKLFGKFASSFLLVKLKSAVKIEFE